MNEKIKLIVAAVVIAVLALVIWACMMRHRKRRMEMKRQAEDRLREEALDKILIGRVDSRRSIGPSVPFDVKYDVDQRKRGEQPNRISVMSPLMVQLTEHNELSTRKYMFHVSERITFGKGSQNDIPISGARIADSQCEIFRIQKRLYVKNTGTSGIVFLQRKNHKTMVDAQSVALENKDRLQIGKFIYEIELL